MDDIGDRVEDAPFGGETVVLEPVAPLIAFVVPRARAQRLEGKGKLPGRARVRETG